MNTKCCVRFLERWGRQLTPYSERDENEAFLALWYESWGPQSKLLAAPCRRKHNLVKPPEFPSCSYSFSRERKGRSFFLIWLPSCVTLGWQQCAAWSHSLRHQLLGLSVKQKAKEEFSKGEVASSLCTWQLSEWNFDDDTAICLKVISISYGRFHSRLVFHSLCLCVLKWKQQNRNIIVFFFLSFIIPSPIGLGLAWSCLKFSFRSCTVFALPVF